MDTQRDKFIKYRTGQKRLQVITHQDIGPQAVFIHGTFCVLGTHLQGMVRPQQECIFHIGMETDSLLLAIAFALHGDDDKRHVINGDGATFRRCDKPIAAVCLALQHAGEQFDKGWPTNQPAFMIPVAIGRNADIKGLRCRLADLAKGIAWAPGRARDMRR